VGGFKLKNLPWEGYGYFLEQHNTCKWSKNCYIVIPLDKPTVGAFRENNDKYVLKINKNVLLSQNAKYFIFHKAFLYWGGK